MDRRTLLIGSVGVLLAGCLPIPYDARYYIPSAPGGELWKWWRLDLADFICFRDAILEVRVRISAAPDTGAWYWLEIWRRTSEPERITAAFADDHMTVRTERGETWRIPLAARDGKPMRFDFAAPTSASQPNNTEWTAPDGTKMLFRVSMHSPDANEVSYKPSGEYFILCDTKGYPGEAFDLTIPVLNYDGGRLVIPPIHFQIQLVHHNFAPIN
jgi:hypothetical protein